MSPTIHSLVFSSNETVACTSSIVRNGLVRSERASFVLVVSENGLADLTSGVCKEQQMFNVVRRALCAALALVLGMVLLSTASRAQTAEPELVKTWTAGGSGIVKLVIASTPQGATATAFGSCHPTACPWGTRPLTVFAPNVSTKLGRVGTATYVTSFSETWLIASLSGPDSLTVQTFTHFTDHSGRSNYAQTVVMH